ncbi:MAG TPA: ABC transporter substrate-binding protein, partial [Actinomycetota bacterium]|nr:ABC transporter substrate-binding protein [Actinomycetota bacterium]
MSTGPAWVPRCRHGAGRSRTTAVAAALALALLAAACSRAGAAASGKGHFRMAIDRPLTLDPVLASQPTDRFIDSQVFDALVGYEATTANVVPGVAQSWTITGNNTVFTFHLQPGARFSDGEPVTADSFIRGMTRALSPALVDAPGSLSGELDEIAGASEVTAGTATTLAGALALNPTTLQIRLSAPDAEFLLRCGDGPFMPIPEASAMAARQPSWAADPLGNGPFALASPPPGGWLSASQIVLVPNPDYVGAAPRIAQAVLKVLPDVNAADRAWRAGQVDWAA